MQGHIHDMYLHTMHVRDVSQKKDIHHSARVVEKNALLTGLEQEVERKKKYDPGARRNLRMGKKIHNGLKITEKSKMIL